MHPGDAPLDQVGDETVVFPRRLVDLRLDPWLHERVARRGIDQRRDPGLVPLPTRDRLLHEFVVDDLGDDPRANVLSPIGVGGKPGAGEHLGADAVDRGDRRRVELRRRPLQASRDRLRVASPPVEQELVEFVEAFGGRAAEHGRRGHEPPSDAVAKLRRRIAGEGRDQDLADGQILIHRQGERHVRRHRVGLAGARAGVDDRAHGERPLGVVEGLVGHSGHDSTYLPAIVNSRSKRV